MAQIQDAQLPEGSRPGTSWRRVFLTGLLFYIASLFALMVTANPNLFPTVVMVGAMLVTVPMTVCPSRESLVTDALFPSESFPMSTSSI